MLDVFGEKKDVNIVFLGGSITEGEGASEKSRCFANRTGEWLKERFGVERIKYHNKGVGGTPSAYGLLRFDRDVAAYEPDMVFVEFAVNDFGADTRKFVEGIVRKLIKLPTKPYVVFLYTTDESYTTKTNYFEEVAEYYGIPQISLKEALRNHLDGANARESGYLQDKVHPTDKGYEVYFNEMKRCLTDEAYYKRPAEGKVKLTEEAFDTKIKFTPSQNVERTGFGEVGGEGERTFAKGKPGDIMEFEFDGEILAFEHGLHKDSAVYEVYVDGKSVGVGDPYFDMRTNQLVMGLAVYDLPSGKHKARLEVKRSGKADRTDKQVLIYNILSGNKIM